jgi:trimeric autotransporter adhesin
MFSAFKNMKNKKSQSFLGSKKAISMKNLILLVLVFGSVIAKGQIFLQSTTDGAFTITPKGIQGSTNSTAINTNLAIGPNALSSNSTGNYNIANGYNSLFSNSTGENNAAFGSEALYSNLVGSNNIAVGYKTLYTNTVGYNNTANGSFSLFNNTEGHSNSSNGYYALYSNTKGASNIANGVYCLYANTEGGSNTANGYLALSGNTLGNSNTAQGASAGVSIVEGSFNTFIGASADAAGDFSNATAIGANAKVDASNKVRIGDNTVTVIEGQVAFTIPSDRRLKENISVSDLGLNFITRLQPVNYNYISDKTKVRHDGFIAQEVEQVMKDLNLPFSGLKKTNDGVYSLAYSDFVMPLVNAVKEQQQQINDLKKQNEILAQRMSALEELKAEIANLKAENLKVADKK